MESKIVLSKEIILGTAGHIDHGKTSLVKAITGTDTDRLKEEKKRGITIELGFASLDLPNGQHIGLIDVPGHEKFIKHMVAGATGIDFVAMIIAADEGVMQQTIEHMEICSLLDIQHGLICLTKIDLVDEEWLELVLDDIKEFSKDTFLENAPVLPVSSHTGEGIPELIKTLETISAVIPPRFASTIFRLPIDRVFTMKGFGTVITGSLISGQINVGETIMIYPTKTTSKVRGIQVHNKNTDTAASGMRTAINFQGLEKTSVKRGYVLGIPEKLKSSYMLDTTFHYLKTNKKPIKNRARIRFHSGTSETIGYLILLEKDEIKPGETGIVQIRLDTPVTCVKDDKFVIRRYSPVRTIGGGKILNPIPEKHQRFKSEIINGIKKIDENQIEDIISFHLDQAGYKGLNIKELIIMTNTSEKQLNKSLVKLMSSQSIIQTSKDNKIFIHKNFMDKIMDKALSNLKDYHSVNPLKEGMSKEELKSKLPVETDTKFFNLILIRLIKENKIFQDKNIVRLAKHSVSLAVDQKEVKKNILKELKESGLSPLGLAALCTKLKIENNLAKDVLMMLVEQKTIIKIKEDLWFHHEPIDILKHNLINFLENNEEISTSDFKKMTGVSRKFVIALIEYFDTQKVTIRIGDIRRLRNKI